MTMLKRVLFCLLVGVLVVPSAWARVQLDAVAAYVNDEAITVSDVVRATPDLQRRLGLTMDSEILNAAFREALDALVGERLVVVAYEAQKRIQIPDSMVRQRIDSIVRDVFRGDRTALLEALAEEGMHYEQWTRQIREQVIVRSMQSHMISGSVRVSPVSVRQRYQEHRDTYSTPGSAELAMIVLSAEQAELAQDLYGQLRGGADFAALAREHSVGPRADVGGARGRMELDMLRDELAAAVRVNAADGVTAPVQAGEHVYLIHVADYTPGGAVPFEDVAARIEEALRVEKEQQLYQTWLAILHRDAYVHIVEPAPF